MPPVPSRAPSVPLPPLGHPRTLSTRCTQNSPLFPPLGVISRPPTRGRLYAQSTRAEEHGRLLLAMLAEGIDDTRNEDEDVAPTPGGRSESDRL